MQPLSSGWRVVPIGRPGAACPTTAGWVSTIPPAGSPQVRAGADAYSPQAPRADGEAGLRPSPLLRLGRMQEGKGPYRMSTVLRLVIESPTLSRTT